jgi:hypothetical protein
MTMTILYKRYYKKIKALSHTHVFASTETADTIADLITQNGFDHPELFRRSVKPAQPTFTQPELSPTASPVFPYQLQKFWRPKPCSMPVHRNMWLH